MGSRTETGIRRLFGQRLIYVIDGLDYVGTSVLPNGQLNVDSRITQAHFEWHRTRPWWQFWKGLG